ncbi:hypothetical protein TRFO_35886 [Tritrichomonas foetus]|uniref:Uncharacterized protein n=1 Tax=Tritrichomonas foetus TaxID=1144522 RepID=A0A1J4JFF9_9EUKA|nr:hypothetical protein TRFO_35886 [Tritrichomonas foetus]|eukprot:OHS97848.1 hypothetical protein TRFO_35886 [Tritrichomonas foetus]
MIISANTTDKAGINNSNLEKNLDLFKSVSNQTQIMPIITVTSNYFQNWIISGVIISLHTQLSLFDLVIENGAKFSKPSQVEIIASNFLINYLDFDSFYGISFPNGYNLEFTLSNMNSFDIGFNGYTFNEVKIEADTFFIKTIFLNCVNASNPTVTFSYSKGYFDFTLFNFTNVNNGEKVQIALDNSWPTGLAKIKLVSESLEKISVIDGQEKGYYIKSYDDIIIDLYPLSLSGDLWICVNSDKCNKPEKGREAFYTVTKNDDELRKLLSSIISFTKVKLIFANENSKVTFPDFPSTTSIGSFDFQGNIENCQVTFVNSPNTRSSYNIDSELYIIDCRVTFMDQYSASRVYIEGTGSISNPSNLNITYQQMIYSNELSRYSGIWFNSISITMLMTNSTDIHFRISRDFICVDNVLSDNKNNESKIKRNSPNENLPPILYKKERIFIFNFNENRNLHFTATGKKISEFTAEININPESKMNIFFIGDEWKEVQENPSFKFTTDLQESCHFEEIPSTIKLIHKNQKRIFLMKPITMKDLYIIGKDYEDVNSVLSCNSENFKFQLNRYCVEYDVKKQNPDEIFTDIQEGVETVDLTFADSSPLHPINLSKISVDILDISIFSEKNNLTINLESSLSTKYRNVKISKTYITFINQNENDSGFNADNLYFDNSAIFDGSVIAEHFIAYLSEYTQFPEKDAKINYLSVYLGYTSDCNALNIIFHKNGYSFNEMNINICEQGNVINNVQLFYTTYNPSLNINLTLDENAQTILNLPFFVYKQASTTAKLVFDESFTQNIYINKLETKPLIYIVQNQKNTIEYEEELIPNSINFTVQTTDYGFDFDFYTTEEMLNYSMEYYKKLGFSQLKCDAAEFNSPASSHYESLFPTVLPTKPSNICTHFVIVFAPNETPKNNEWGKWNEYREYLTRKIRRKISSSSNTKSPSSFEYSMKFLSSNIERSIDAIFVQNDINKALSEVPIGTEILIILQIGEIKENQKYNFSSLSTRVDVHIIPFHDDDIDSKNTKNSELHQIYIESNDQNKSNYVTIYNSCINFISNDMKTVSLNQVGLIGCEISNDILLIQSSYVLVDLFTLISLNSTKLEQYNSKLALFLPESLDTISLTFYNDGFEIDVDEDIKKIIPRNREAFIPNRLLDDSTRKLFIPLSYFYDMISISCKANKVIMNVANGALFIGYVINVSSLSNSLKVEFVGNWGDVFTLNPLVFEVNNKNATFENHPSKIEISVYETYHPSYESGIKEINFKIDNQLNPGEIVGIVIGTIAFVVIVILLIVCQIAKKNKESSLGSDFSDM